MEQKILPPINDELGLEQGNKDPGELYVSYSSEHLLNAQASGLGVSLPSVESSSLSSKRMDVSSIGQADDVVLVSTDLFLLKHLLELSKSFCKKYHVILAPDKTKLVAFHSKKQKFTVDYQLNTISLDIEGLPIEPTNSAEHVGILRSSSGNLPYVQARISAHSRALFLVLPCGLAKKHNTNPSASLRIQSLYALPVLMSGVASVNLLQSEINILSRHFRKTLRLLMKLPEKTPDIAVYYLAGSLSFEGHLHIKQLSLFGMISRLPDCPLHSFAIHALTTLPDSNKSFFVNIRKLCNQYNLETPLSILENPPEKSSFKSLITSKIVDYWNNMFRVEIKSLSLLQHFRIEFMSLVKPHPVWTTCENNPFEVNKAIIMATMMSGRYKTDYLSRHWNPENPLGLCMHCGNISRKTGTLFHYFVECEHFQEMRERIYQAWETRLEDNSYVLNMFNQRKHTPKSFFCLLIDPSSDSEIIHGTQMQMFSFNPTFHLCRTFCYAIHRQRIKLLSDVEIKQ